jgi:DNA-binding beta-propeller fold protein YncE
MKLIALKLTMAIFVAIALAAGSCAGRGGIQEPRPEIVWPPSPQQPRIRFIGTVSEPPDLRITDSVFKKIWAYIIAQPASTLVAPYGVQTDAAGRLYVVDTYLRTVHAFDVPSNEYYRFAARKAAFTSPVDIAIDDRNGTIYVSDSQDGCIKIFQDAGRRFVGEIGRGVLERPTGIAVNPVTDELLVVDTLSANIVRYDLGEGDIKGFFGGTGRRNGRFHYPTNIDVTADGEILITDTLNFRIQIFSPQGAFLASFGSAGNGPGYFSRPKGVASDSDGNIYVVDGLFDNVQVFDRQGRLLLAFGGPGQDYGQFWLPTGIFIDPDDRIYVADSYNKRIQIFQYLKRE